MNCKLLYVAIILAAFSSCNNNKDQEKQKFVETGYMDSAVKPGDNFYLYVNGKWIDSATIPSTETGIGAFFDIYVIIFIHHFHPAKTSL